MIRLTVSLLLVVTLSGCLSSRDTRYIGNFSNPLCAPDGSVIYFQYADLKGEFPEPTSKTANCPWNK